MAKRRYTSKCSKFLIHLDLPDGTHTVIDFKGKNVYTKERYTDVEDPQIQKLLEATEAFGVYFEKSSEFDWMEAEENAAKQAEEIEEIQPEEGDLIEDFDTGELYVFKNGNLEELPETETINEETPTEDVETKEEIPSEEENTSDNKADVKVFTTGAEAKSWLNETHKVPFNKLTNKARMIEEAALLGYAIEFENK